MQAIRAILEPPETPPRDTKITVSKGKQVQDHPRLSEALAQYHAMRKARYSDKTVTGEMYVLRRFLAWLGEDIQVRHLRPERVEDWFVSIRSDHTTRDGKERPRSRRTPTTTT